MARYPKGSGKKNEKSRSKMKIEPPKQKTQSKIEAIEKLKSLETSQSTDFDSNIERIQAEIAAETSQNITQKAEIESKIELNASPKDQSIQKSDSKIEIEKPFSESEVKKTAKDYEGLISIALTGVSKGAVYLMKDSRAEMPDKIKEPLKENLSIVAAILWPDVEGMSEREKMLMFAGFACFNSASEYASHLVEVKNGSKDKVLKDVSKTTTTVS